MPPKCSSQRKNNNSRCSFLDKVAQLSKRRQHNNHGDGASAAAAAVKKSDETTASSVTSTSSINSSFNRSWRNVRIIPVKWQSEHSLLSSSSSSSSSSKKKKKRRVVRFDETQNQYFDSDTQEEPCHDHEDVMEDLWYNNFELTMFKSKVAIVCARISRDECGLGKSNSNGKQSRSNRPSTSSSSSRLPSYQRIVQCIFDECTSCNDEENDIIDLLPEQYENWIKLLRRHPGRMGLEKYIVQSIAVDQYERQQRMVELVQQLQFHLQVVNNSSNSNNNPSSSRSTTSTDKKKKKNNNNNAGGDADEMIRKACMAASLPSRLFARFTALANAATEDDGDDDVSGKNFSSAANVSAISDLPAATASAAAAASALASLLDQDEQEWPHRALLDDEGVL
jgi:hypothetical protein